VDLDDALGEVVFGRRAFTTRLPTAAPMKEPGAFNQSPSPGTTSRCGLTPLVDLPCPYIDCETSISAQRPIPFFSSHHVPIRALAQSYSRGPFAPSPAPDETSVLLRAEIGQRPHGEIIERAQRFQHRKLTTQRIERDHRRPADRPMSTGRGFPGHNQPTVIRDGNVATFNDHAIDDIGRAQTERGDEPDSVEEGQWRRAAFTLAVPPTACEPDAADGGKQRRTDARRRRTRTDHLRTGASASATEMVPDPHSVLFVVTAKRPLAMHEPHHANPDAVVDIHAQQEKVIVPRQRATITDQQPVPQPCSPLEQMDLRNLRRNLHEPTIATRHAWDPRS
jgi:hypothetical protein